MNIRKFLEYSLALFRCKVARSYFMPSSNTDFAKANNKEPFRGFFNYLRLQLFDIYTFLSNIIDFCIFICYNCFVLFVKVWNIHRLRDPVAVESSSYRQYVRSWYSQVYICSLLPIVATAYPSETSRRSQPSWRPSIGTTRSDMDSPVSHEIHTTSREVAMLIK